MIKRLSAGARSARRLRRGRIAAALIAGLAMVTGGAPTQADDFDYYVMALSWSPTWCASETARGDPPEQCAPDRDLGFSLHGLWPQYADGGWPEYCDTAARDPARRDSAAMADIMGSSGLAWYQWKKHGRCTGLSSADYFDLSRRAYQSIALPSFASGPKTAKTIGQAFLDANPWLRADDLIVDCAEGRLREVRICLTTDLEARACAADVQRDACRVEAPLELPPIP